ncbi:MAG: SDR family NAD(P)-dependent oxidoreductase [Spirochaetota bacterium]
MRGFIITGTSRGLGQALAEQALREGGAVHGIARNRNEQLERSAGHAEGVLTHHVADLNEVERIPQLAGEIVRRLESRQLEELVLINNAGVLDPIGPVAELEPGLLHRHITVNVTALMQLTGAVLAQTHGAAYRRTVVNISSGAAANPYYGWAPYCTAKAAVEMFTRVLAVEYEGDRSLRVLSVAPGVVDTDMQARIRKTDERRFPHRPKFVHLKESGKLYTTEHAAELVLRAAGDEHIESGQSVDVRAHYG